MLGDHGFQDHSDMQPSIADFSGHEQWDQIQEASLSTKLRKERRRRFNKLNGQGIVEHQVVRGGTEVYQALVKEASKLKTELLKEKGRRLDPLLSASTGAFLASLSCGPLKNNLPPQGAVAHVLSVNG